MVLQRQEVRQSSMRQNIGGEREMPFFFPLNITDGSRHAPAGVKAPISTIKEAEPALESDETAVDPEKFWAAWHSHKEYLIKLSMLWMNVSAADAEDAFSDATIRAYEKYATHAPQISNERAWFARLLHNICIDRHRSNSRIKNLFEKIKEINSIDFSIMENGTPTPEHLLLNNELGRMMTRAINSLPERLRAPVILRLVQGEEYDNIARALGISNDNARKRVQQARILLRQSLAGLRD